MTIQFRGGVSDVLLAPVGGAFTGLAARLAPLVLSAAAALGLADCHSEADLHIRSPGTVGPLPPVDGGVRDSAVYQATGCFDPAQDHYIEVHGPDNSCSRFRILPPGLEVQASVPTFDVPLVFASNPGVVSGLGAVLTSQRRDQYHYNLQVVSYHNPSGGAGCSFNGVITYAGTLDATGGVPFPLYSPYSLNGVTQSCRGDDHYGNQASVPLRVNGPVTVDFVPDTAVSIDGSNATLRYFHQTRPAR